MGKRNYLIEGVSGAGKSSVCQELLNRGLQAIDGDKELAYQGDPETGQPTEGFSHKNHIWDVSKVQSLIENHENEVAFFCGGSRNFDKFIHLFYDVLVLNIDVDTLNKRLDSRPPNTWGGNKEQRELILKLHASREDVPANAKLIDASAPLMEVVDEILRYVDASS